MASERTLFDARRAAREAQKNQLKKRIAQSQDEIVGLRAQQAAKAREAELIVGRAEGRARPLRRRTSCSSRA